MTVSNIIEKALEIIYPPVCALCGKVNKNYLCEDCKKELEKIEFYGEERYSKKYKYFSKHVYLFKYIGYIRKMIIEYKFLDKAYYYKTFSKILLNNKKICENLKTYDIIISVPIHNKRKRKRGYNQSALIAREIARNVQNLEFVDLLIKIKNNKPQSMLNKEDRQNNVQNVYRIKENKKMKEKLLNKKIIIFDDIYTTGSTVNECAKIIKRYKTKEIEILTIAKD